MTIKLTIKDLEDERNIHKAIVKDFDELREELKKIKVKYK